MNWRKVPLQQAATRLREACGRVIWIDRRVDPLTPVTLVQQQGETLELAMRRLASKLGEATEEGITTKTKTAATPLAAQAVAGTVYLGPARANLLTRIANRLEDIGRLPKRNKQAYLARDAIAWPRLTEPRRLITSLLEEKGIEVGSADLIPHDLWTNQQLPAAPMADQITLLLAGFDLDWRVGNRGRRVRITRASSPTPVVAVHQVRSANAFSIVEIQKHLGPDAELRIDSRRVTLRGTVEQHAKLRRLLSPTNPNRPSYKPALVGEQDRWQDQRFTLRVSDQQPLLVLRGLAKQLGLEIEADAAAIAALDNSERISFETKQATLDELLQMLADAAGVSVSRNGRTLVIRAIGRPR